MNSEKLDQILESYIQNFSGDWWQKEKYKWETIKQFKENWNLNAENFAVMLENSIRQSNLFDSRKYPRKMIIAFARDFPDETRNMFNNLFNNNGDIYEKIKEFKSDSEKLLSKYNVKNNESLNEHYQDENTVSTYLWLYNSDKFFIYKLSEVRKVAEVVDYEYSFRRAYREDQLRDNLEHFLDLYEKIRLFLVQKGIFKGLLQSVMDDNCYPDPNLVTITIDYCFYISRVIGKWFPENYSPNINIDKWEKLLKNTEVFNEQSLEIMKRIKDFGGQATCSQLSQKYGNTVEYYKNNSISLAKRISEATKCNVYEDEDGNKKWWPILYTGTDATNDDSGSYVWKLREELLRALDRVDLSNIRLYEEKQEKGYWWVNAKPAIWQFSNLPVGKEEYYTLLNENQKPRRIPRNFKSAKVGDLIVGYDATPTKQVVALGEVSAKEQDKIYFKKTEELKFPISYNTLRDYPELSNMEFFKNPNGSLFKLTKDEYYFILRLINNEIITSYDGQTKSLNVILYGPPGTGKTYESIKMAVKICNPSFDDLDEKTYEEYVEEYNKLLYKNKNDNDYQIIFTTFHQSYSYEDFIEGIRPVLNHDSRGVDYEEHTGVFKQICNTAKENSNKNYVIIIDEINRGNISKIFGELITLIEKSKRDGKEGAKVILPYSNDAFIVPSNVFIIGTMNTADRSIALLDTALRRRFDFVEKMPNIDLLDGKIIKGVNIKKLLEKINTRIEYLLDKNHTIGHSFFIKLNSSSTIEDLDNIFKQNIIPLLEEYFYDDYSKIQLVLGDNAKSDEYKFIKNDDNYGEKVFAGSVDDIIDLQKTRYYINSSAFGKPESYIKIYE